MVKDKTIDLDSVLNLCKSSERIQYELCNRSKLWEILVKRHFPSYISWIANLKQRCDGSVADWFDRFLILSKYSKHLRNLRSHVQTEKGLKKLHCALTIRDATLFVVENDVFVRDNNDPYSQVEKNVKVSAYQKRNPKSPEIEFPLFK